MITQTYFTIDDVAKMLGVHHMTIRNWIKRGDLAIVRLPGTGIRISQDEIMRITAQTIQKSEESK